MGERQKLKIWGMGLLWGSVLEGVWMGMAESLLSHEMLRELDLYTQQSRMRFGL